MSEHRFPVVTELHRDMTVDQALQWFNGILSGSDWGAKDRIEVISDEGLRTIQLTAWGTTWTLEVDIQESRVLGGVLISLCVRNPSPDFPLNDLARLSKVMVP